MTMMGMRRAAQARMQRVIERAKVRQVAPVPAPAPVSSHDRARIAKWIRDRVVADWRGGCWHCRKPFAFGHRFVDVRGDEVVVRFHARCESEWRRAQETAARRALGLPDDKEHRHEHN